ncbi:major facilitator superfamily transporter [Hypoxylon sp. FL1857]|nr:major facilitator superfamily transporter [Hypoxylon sp. FL1857]
MEPRSGNANRSEDTETLVLASSDSSLHLEIGSQELPVLRFWLLSIGLLTGLLLSFLDTSIVATSIFAIATEFDDLTIVNWVALAYTLAYLGFAVLLARISDVIGRRDAFIIFYFIFITFSIACGFSRSLVELIACRAVQGLGGSGLYSITMIILPEVAPRKMQKYIGGLIGVVMTLSSVLGPVLGGALTQYTTWHWIFWINGPVGVLSMLLFYLSWPKKEYLPIAEKKSWKELDYVGSILLIAAAVLVVFPFQNAGLDADQWSKAKAIFVAPLVAGVALWLGLFIWCIYIDLRWGHVMSAALPVRLLRDHVYAAIVANTLLLGFPYMLVIYAFPLRLQIVNGKDPLMAGLMLLPMLGSSAVGSFFSGAFNTKKNMIFETVITGTCFVVLGCGLLSTLSSSHEVEPKALGFLVFVGLGFGMVVSTATLAARIHSSDKDHASAQGLVAQVRVLGGSIGIAASTAIAGAMLRKKMKHVHGRQLASLEGRSDVLSQTLPAAVRQAYSDAFNEDMRVCAIIGGVAVLVALGAFSRKRLTLDGRMEQQSKEKLARQNATQSSPTLVDHAATESLHSQG